MPTLRLIAATFAACLCALGLSVGAALAEGPHEPGAKKPAHVTPAGLCLLDDVAKR